MVGKKRNLIFHISKKKEKEAQIQSIIHNTVGMGAMGSQVQKFSLTGRQADRQAGRQASRQAGGQAGSLAK